MKSIVTDSARNVTGWMGRVRQAIPPKGKTGEPPCCIVNGSSADVRFTSRLHSSGKPGRKTHGALPFDSFLSGFGLRCRHSYPRQSEYARKYSRGPLLPADQNGRNLWLCRVRRRAGVVMLLQRCIRLSWLPRNANRGRKRLVRCRRNTTCTVQVAKGLMSCLSPFNP